MGAILCNLETDLKKESLVVSLNEEDGSNCQRCFTVGLIKTRPQNLKKNKKIKKGDKTIFYLSTEEKKIRRGTLTVSFSIIKSK